MKNKILQGDALTKLKELPEKSVNMCMTSPPYWALRDYGDATSGTIWGGDESCEHDWKKHIKKPSGGKGSKGANVGSNKNDFANMRDHDVVSNFCQKCGAWKGQLGLEPTFDQYISNLCDIFDEVKRVLRDDGTCWVNIGDSYGSGKGEESKKKQIKSLEHKSKVNGYEKCLLGIPFRFALEMVNRGWILRNTIIWHKPNAMPSSVKDRFTVDFEYIFFFSKKKNYYFEQQLDPYTSPVDRWGGEQVAKYSGKFSDKDDNDNYNSPRARCSRPNYPERERTLRPNPNGKNKRTMWSINTKPYPEAHFAVYPEELCETPIKAGCPEGGIILDPFFGAGTTGLVALKQKKNFIGIELNPEYIEIAEKRLKPFQDQTTLFLNNTNGAENEM